MKTRTVDFPVEMRSPQVLNPEAVVGLIALLKSCQLVACSLTGELLWKTQLENRCQLAAIGHEQIWLFESHAVVVVGGADGKTDCRIEIPIEADEKIGCVAVSEDALYLSVYRCKTHPEFGMSPRVLRTSLDGETMWESRLPIDTIAYHGCVHTGVATNWKIRPIPPRTPDSWLPHGDDPLIVSGNRLLATFKEWSRSGIGCRYVLDIETGSLLWQSEPLPVQNVAAGGSGKFLMGAQGYGAFETALYQDKVDSMPHWKSHGHCFESEPSRYFCIQTRNVIPSPQFCVELLNDGSVKKLSPQLDGFYTSKPQLLSDGHAYFWRAEQIWRWNLQAGIERVANTGLGDRSFASSLKFSESKIGFHIRRNQSGSTQSASEFITFES